MLHYKIPNGPHASIVLVGTVLSFLTWPSTSELWVGEMLRVRSANTPGATGYILR